MAFTFLCQDCGRRYRASARHCGRGFLCTRCGWPVLVPRSAGAPVPAGRIGEPEAEPRRPRPDGSIGRELPT